MRNTAGTKKDFVELSFISALFLGLTLFSSCASMVADTKSADTRPAYAASANPSASSVELIFTKGGKSRSQN
jgi:hypothetical protein